MSSSGEIQLFHAQLQKLGRELEHAEQRLRNATARHSTRGPAGPRAARRR